MVKQKGGDKLKKTLTIKDIEEIYGFTREYSLKLFKMDGCPLLPRVARGSYRVLAEEFDKWLKELV